MANRRSIFLRHQVTPFVILFVERAGSTYLTTTLNAHPDILSLGEQLDVLAQQGKNSQEQLAWSKDFLTPPLVGRNKARGFKTKLVDVLDPPGFAAILRQRKSKVILLLRRNSIKAVVSTINAKRLWEKSGYWNLLDESNRMSAFNVDLELFDELLQTRLRLDEEIENYVQSLQVPTLLLYYEDLLESKEEFLNRVFSFLNVKPQAVDGITKKHTSDDLRDVILNYDELYARYKDTSFAPMFEEVLVP